MINDRVAQLIKDRGITRLCHFTRSKNALHILSSEDGIIAVDFLSDDLYEPNDLQRLDGKKDYVNCSIQYPNTWYLDKIKNSDPLFKEWVILFINPLLAALDSSKYCCRNAAYARGALIKEGYEAFEELFNHTVGNYSRTAEMLPCCPTDGQAEVLIYKNIPRTDIIGIAVPDEEQAKEEMDRYEVLNIKPPNIYIAPDLFCDTWSYKIKAGIVPTEILYERRR